MPLTSGDQLGPYEILSPIGAGGMGEVYKARDTRLDRTVAIKVLPDHIAKRDDVRQRFEHEARAVASLNHPNICILHDIGRHESTGYYMVMEFMDGETLGDRKSEASVWRWSGRFPAYHANRISRLLFLSVSVDAFRFPCESWLNFSQPTSRP